MITKKKKRKIIFAVLVSFLIFFFIGFLFVYSSETEIERNDYVNSRSKIDVNKITERIDVMTDEEIEKTIQEIEQEIERLKSGI